MRCSTSHGHALVTPFQLQSYTSAAAEGWLPLMWFADGHRCAGRRRDHVSRLFVSRLGPFAPLERMDRYPIDFSLLWMGLHVQYDWTGMAEILAAGLFLGWMRWRSGSTLLTFLLHALFNLEGMFETMAQVKHLF